MAIIALIVTPLIMSIIKKAKISADKRSIDAYGRSIELAIVGYLMDTGSFPTSIGELTIEYRGEEVVCSEKKINSDSSVYLANCKVGGRSVDYTYGKNKGSSDTIGRSVKYNDIDYYVIDETPGTLTLLKAVPLTISEVNTYGVGHVNMYITSDPNTDVYQTAYDNSGYGGMAYYSSSTCGWNGSEWVETGCTTSYEESEVKFVVDAWTEANTISSDLRTDSTGYKARILTMDDLIDNLGYSWEQNVTGSPIVNDNVPRFLIPDDNYYWYWTMSQHEEDNNRVWYVTEEGNLLPQDIDYSGCVVIPVITVDKSKVQ